MFFFTVFVVFLLLLSHCKKKTKNNKLSEFYLEFTHVEMTG